MPFGKIKSQTDYKTYVVGGGTKTYPAWKAEQDKKKKKKKKKYGMIASGGPNYIVPAVALTPRPFISSETHETDSWNGESVLRNKMKSVKKIQLKYRGVPYSKTH